jgi:hypothetical protein
MKTLVTLFTNYITKNPKTSFGSLLALVGLGLHWAGIIDGEQYGTGMSIVMIYMGVVAGDSKNQ